MIIHTIVLCCWLHLSNGVPNPIPNKLLPIPIYNDKIHFPNEHGENQMQNTQPIYSINQQKIFDSILIARAPTSLPVQKINLPQLPSDQYLKFHAQQFIKKLDQELTRKKQLFSFNILFSPVSILEVIYLLLLGAGGKTKDEIINLLFDKNIAANINLNQIHETFGKALNKIEQSSDNINNLVAHIASGLFLQNGLNLNHNYLATAKSIYNCEIDILDFNKNANHAMLSINNWVNNKTLGKITHILDTKPLPETQLFIVSTLYFHGDWEKPFSAAYTNRHAFYTNGNKNPPTAAIDLMGTVDEYLYYNDPVLNCTIVGLPYKGYSTYFYSILPFNSNKEQLQALKQSLTPEHIDRLLKNLQPRTITLLLPKMSVTKSILLNEPLFNLNVTTLFNTNLANLSNILTNSSSPLYVNEIRHKVVLDVTEQGTTGAAATSVNIARTLHTIVRLDTPFLFFIRNVQSQLDLFWGSIELPTPNYPIT